MIIMTILRGKLRLSGPECPSFPGSYCPNTLHWSRNTFFFILNLGIGIKIDTWFLPPPPPPLFLPPIIATIVTSKVIEN